MSTSRISLSSPTLAGRVKKYDSYSGSRGSGILANRQRKTESATTQQIRFSTQETSTSKINYSDKKTSFYKQTETPVLAKNKLALEAVRKTPSLKEAVFADQVVSLQSTYPKKKLTKKQKLFYGFGVLVFLFAIGTSIQTLLVNQKAQEQIGVLGVSSDDQGVSEGNGNEPAEEPVSAEAIANYQVSPELPRYLRIPKLGVFARIKHTGIDSSGAVDAPWNIHDVSWYNQSAKPGNANGSSLLLGHVSGWTGPGVFKNIDKLVAGDRFEVEKGSGEKITYEVTRGERLPLDQVRMSRILASEVRGVHDLKLMTCSGRYNSDTESFEERYIVYAKILR